MPLWDATLQYPKGVNTVEEIEAYWVRFLTDRNLTLIDDGRPVTVYASTGRWVADCPYCAGGIAIHRDWDRCACLSCGHTYTPEWPDGTDEAERLLERRAQKNQNWSAGEPVETLAAENELMKHELWERA